MSVFDYKKYKAIISDFDGTISGKDFVVTDQVKKAICAVREKKMHFIIASGRSFTGPIAMLCEELQLVDPQIIRGGAEIIDPVQKKVIMAEYILDDSLQKLLDILKNAHIDHWVEKGSCIYTKNAQSHYSFGEVLYKNLEEVDISHVPKVGIFPLSNPEKETVFETMLQKEFTNLHITKSFSPFGNTWDITASMANKQEGIRKVADMLGLQRDELIGIGDGYNDFPLLEACGLKVAMGNAHDELKAIADEVIPSYEEDGVAVFLSGLLSK
jgi:Cof subfamily protein (haloacid dehalogenase superfamily)